jgi:RNA-binding protein
MPITEKQRRHLKGLAHHMKPVVIVGQNGLTDNLFSELRSALDTHELIKVRVNAGDRGDRRKMVDAISKRCDAELIQTIGHVAAFYRRHPKHPRIRLPV